MDEEDNDSIALTTDGQLTIVTFITMTVLVVMIIIHVNS